MNSDALDRAFSALADPTRRAILAHLSRGAATVGELAGPLTVSLPAVSRHLDVLERAGLIARGRRAQWRPCALRPEALRDAADWIARTTAHWEGSFDRMAEVLAQTAQETPDDPAPTQD